MDTRQLRIYLDNVIVSAIVRGDLADREDREALETLQRSPCRDRIVAIGAEVVTSRESWREQERTTNPEVRDQLRQGRQGIPVVSNDHRVLAYSSQPDQYGGFTACPLVSDVPDEALWQRVGNLCLGIADARHLMYALCNQCQRFVTTDAHFLGIRCTIEAKFPEIRIVRPRELLAELREA